MNLHFVIICSWIVAIFLLIKRRHEIVATIKRLPMKWRIVIGVLLIGCAFIPGPLDDLIVLGIIAKLTK